MLSIISIIEGLLVIVPALLSVAFVTIAERKTMASMQRRFGPNIVGQLKANISFKRSYLYYNSPFIINNNINRMEGIITRRFSSSLC